MVQMKGTLSLRRGVPAHTVFISHMVQMKDNMTETLKKDQYQLYIPHGSDESLTTLSILAL